MFENDQLPILQGLSPASLAALHRAIARAWADDETKPLHRRIYRMLETPDWRQWCRALEAELSRRGQSYLGFCG